MTRPPYYKYSLEFKTKVIKEAMSGEKPKSLIAKEFNIWPDAMHRWIREYKHGKHGGVVENKTIKTNNKKDGGKMPISTQAAYQIQVYTERHVLVGMFYKTAKEAEHKLNGVERVVKKWSQRLKFSEASILLVERSRNFYEGEVVSNDEKTLFTKHIIVKAYRGE